MASPWQLKNRQRREMVNGAGSNGPTATAKDYIPIDQQISTFGEQQQAQSSMDDLYKRAQAGDSDAMRQVGQANDRLRSANTAVDEMKNEGRAKYLEDAQAVAAENPLSMGSKQGANGKLYRDYTLEDIKNEVGDDREKVWQWVEQHSKDGFEAGPLTKQYLGMASDEQTPNAIPSSEQPKTVEQAPIEQAPIEQAPIDNAETPKQAADQVVGSIGAEKADARTKSDIRDITSSLWQAYNDGRFGPKGSPEAKQARNYFIMDSLMTAAKNWRNADRQYLGNLSAAISGKDMDFSDTNTEKSKWEQMRENAINRYEKGQDTLAESDYNTAANIGTSEDMATYAQNAGTQGLAQAAAGAQATQGAFDTVTSAYSNANNEQIQAAADAMLKDPVNQSALNALELKLKNATFDADVEAAKLANSMSKEQIAMMMQQARLLGYEGDFKQVSAKLLGDLQKGTIDPKTLAGVVGVAALNKLGA